MVSRRGAHGPADVVFGGVSPDVPRDSTVVAASTPGVGGAPAAVRRTAPLSWAQAQEVARGDTEASFERAGVVRWTLLVVGALLVAGIAAGVVWSVLAQPPGYTVSADGASMGEAAAGQQFGVEVVYAGLAAAVGLATGALAGVRLSRYGWVLVVTLAIGSSGAAFVSLAVGRRLGPPDPSLVVAGASIGDVVPTQLEVAAHGLLLVWPVATLVGLLAAVAVSGRRNGDSDPAHVAGPTSERPRPVHDSPDLSSTSSSYRTRTDTC